jgi:hypothetical protein
MPIQQVETKDGELRWESPRGSLRVRRPARDVVVFVEEGFLEKGFAKLILEHLDRAIAEGARPEIFVDAYRLDGYDSAVRTGATDWLKRHHDSVRRQHMLVQSKLTRMGLSVASLTLGGVLVGHTSPNEFQAEIQRAVRESRPPEN